MFSYIGVKDQFKLQPARKLFIWPCHRLLQITHFSPVLALFPQRQQQNITISLFSTLLPIFYHKDYLCRGACKNIYNTTTTEQQQQQNFFPRPIRQLYNISDLLASRLYNDSISCPTLTPRKIKTF